MSAALKLHPSPDTEAAQRLAALLALPLRAEPPTEEEDAIFAEIEAEVRAGVQGVPHAEMRARLEELRRERGG